MKHERKSLAEIAVWYSIAITASAFVFLFVMAALVAIPGLDHWAVILAVLVAWLVAIAVSTRKLIRSDLVTKSTTSLVPLHMLQVVLIVSTIPHAIFSASADWHIFTGMVLTWEVWGVVFTLSFLLLAALAKKPVGFRTWGTSALTTAVVFFAVYRRL